MSAGQEDISTNLGLGVQLLVLCIAGRDSGHVTSQENWAARGQHHLNRVYQIRANSHAPPLQHDSPTSPCERSALTRVQRSRAPVVGGGLEAKAVVGFTTASFLLTVSPWDVTVSF